MRGLLDSRPAPAVVLGASVAMVVAISIGDSITGPYLVFATFYLIPVVVAAWYAGRAPALLVGLLAALAGVMSTAIDPGEVTLPVLVWNGVFRFFTYAFIAVLVDAERRARATISELSAIDLLTGLSNRRRFYEQAELELQRAHRSHGSIAVIYIDLDDLKLRNDTYGHQAGDDMLAEFADIARTTFRSTDLLARLGGDEFCFLLPGAGLSVAKMTLGRFVTALSQAHVLPMRVSAGVVAGSVDADTDVESIVHSADRLMYQAKQSGKGQCRTRATLTGGAATSGPADLPPT